MKKQETNKKQDTNIHLVGLDLGKKPPQAIDIERAVLGALMMEQDAIICVQNILKSEYFYKDAHQKIYSAILSLSERNNPIDILTVSDELEKMGVLDEIGGRAYIGELSGVVGSSAHLEFHAKVVVEKYIKRALIAMSNETIKECFDDYVTTDDALSSADTRMRNIFENTFNHSNLRHISVIAGEAVNAMYKRVEDRNKGKAPGITTGFIELDNLTFGWKHGELIILAARPAMGKSAIMLHFAKSAADIGKAALIFSLEMQDTQLADRLLLSEENISPERYKSGYMLDSEMKMIEVSLGKIEKKNIYIDHTGGINMRHIHNCAKIMQKRGKCDIVFIDYLQLCRCENRYGYNRNDEVSELSRQAKTMAKDLNVPVILLSQLNREADKRPKQQQSQTPEETQSYAPKLSDLRDSGAIEQDADLVIFVYRPDYYKTPVAGEVQNYGELIVAKNRNGKCGKISFIHENGMTKFKDYLDDTDFLNQR